MKSLNSPHEKANWESDLLKDLVFIKAKKRFPISKKTIAPAGVISLMLIVIIRISWPLFFTNSIDSLLVKSLMFALVILMIFTVFFQFYRVLKFDTITTPLHVQENITALKKFMSANHLAFTQHSESPEVFMIISRNLDMNPNKEYREVMVFIADDKQILVNSHFTRTKFSIAPPSRNYKKMAKMLKEWLHGYINKADSKDVAIKRF